jgi:hypothetical protein
MRNPIRNIPAPMASWLCLWAVIGVAAHTGAMEIVVSPRNDAGSEKASPAKPRCVEAPCSAAATTAAWPYRPEAGMGQGEAASSAAPRRVRRIALDAVPQPR